MTEQDVRVIEAFYCLGVGFLLLRFAYEAVWGFLKDEPTSELLIAFALCVAWPVTVPIYLVDLALGLVKDDE